MFLEFDKHRRDKDIIPFIKNGIIVDTSIILILVEGLIATRISRKKLQELPEYDRLLGIFDRIKLNKIRINNKWGRFIITPHILTEVCTHLRNEYNKRSDYKKVVEEILPILGEMAEELVKKEDIINHIDFNNPIIEIGDISIFLVAETMINDRKPIAIFAKDAGINKKFQDHPKVMVMDYNSLALNLP